MKLIFIYNTDAGLFNLLTDMAHKAMSPKTYACSLCAITHGPIKMHNACQSLDELRTLVEQFLSDPT